MQVKTVVTGAALAASLLVSAAAQTVQIKDAWVRTAVPGQMATGAFMKITARENTKLVSATSPVAGVAQVHEMKMEGDVMKMRAVVGGLDLPAGKTVELKPGGLHVMLMGLKSQVKAGDKVPLTLVFEGKDKKRETVLVQAEVRQLGAMPDAMPMKMH